MERYNYVDAQKRGKIERVDYMAVTKEGEEIAKYANVYLPYGYSADKKYNILYLMHGGGGSPDAWFDGSYLKNMLDTMIAKEEVEPLIVVTPTYYTGQWSGLNPNWETEQTLFFMEEVTTKLFPAVEGKYSTYAESTDKEGLVASRKHRAYSGFSMGACTTWWMFTHHLDEVAYFMPLSGDCWIKAVRGGADYPVETAEALKDIATASGRDFFIYALTGTKDIAYGNLKPQIDEMVKHDIFGKNNLKYHFEPDFEHCYPDVLSYLKLALPEMFK